MRWLPILLLTILLVGSLPVSTGSPDLAANPDTRHLWPMKEGSGTTVEDIVGTQDGTLTGQGVEDPPAWKAEVGFNYLSWQDTDGGSVSAGPAPQWTTGNEVSVIVWAKQTSIITTRIFGLTDSTKTGSPILSLETRSTGEIRWTARGEDGSLSDILCPHSYDDGNWHLYIGEISGSSSNLFINDSLCGNTSGPDMRMNFSDLTIELGALSSDTGVLNFYKGDMSGFAIVDGLLSPTEKTEVFENGPPLGLNAVEPNPEENPNKVLFVPRENPEVGIFNSSDDSVIYSPVSNECPCGGGVLLEDGRVLMYPRDTTNEFSYFNTTTFTISAGPTWDNNGQFIGEDIGDDGRVYLAPINRFSGNLGVGIVDPDTNTFSRGATTDGGYFGAVKVNDGRIILIPRDAQTDHIGIYNSTTDTFTQGPEVTGITVSTGASDSGRKFTGGLLDSLGRVIMAPHSSNRIGIFDPSNDSFIPGPIVNPDNIDAYFRTGGPTTDGRIIFAPHNSDNIGIFDPNSDTFTEGPTHGQGSEAYAGVNVPLPDGRLIFPPFNAGNIGIFDPSDNTFSLGPSSPSGTTLFQQALNLGISTGEFTPTPPPTLPDGWESPVGTDPIFTFPSNATPRGVALTTNPRKSEWSIMTGYLTETQEGVIDLLKTSDQGTNIESSNFRVNAGDIEVGGMAQGPDLYKGCFQEEGSGGSRVMFYITKDGSSFQLLNAATHGTQPLHCDVATPRDEAGREDWTGIVYGDSFTRSSWFVMDNKGSLETPRVELPGSRQTGTDMVIRIKDADLTTYVSSTITGGSRLDPILGAGIHWHALADLNNLIKIRSFHHVIETEGHETLANALTNSNLNHADTAISSVNNVMNVWADDLNNEIKFIETDPRGTSTIIRDPLDLKQGNITNPNADVTWIQLEPTGQGTYSGAYTDTNGNLVYFETLDNGATWNTSTIASDVPTVQGTNLQKFDISYDRINESIVLVWTTETGIRLAFKPLISGTALIDVERDWDTRPLEEKFREPDTFIGVNLQDQGDSTGIGLFGVKMLIIAAFTGLTIMFTYLFTFNAIMALGAGGSMSLLLLVVWGVMPLWVLIALVFFAAYIITNHFTKRSDTGGDTE